ncbi:hypothetical protein GYMLUDRAFT_77779 [Collybiopsis luxurians FD-317 M1]|uniref:Uncharacterized protein n=1 Tax=Collybiopsis luxurians FD-317 M1 TaxID=944289 RepID=A0A0D0BD96_9AGAR|nr:hypothetical protein GYMLUDRAFT_77779 [Collybiopsis luxurians FD-317 M1]
MFTLKRGNLELNVAGMKIPCRAVPGGGYHCPFSRVDNKCKFNGPIEALEQHVHQNHQHALKSILQLSDRVHTAEYSELILSPGSTAGLTVRDPSPRISRYVQGAQAHKVRRESSRERSPVRLASSMSPPSISRVPSASMQNGSQASLIPSSFSSSQTLTLPPGYSYKTTTDSRNVPKRQPKTSIVPKASPAPAVAPKPSVVPKAPAAYPTPPTLTAPSSSTARSPTHAYNPDLLDINSKPITYNGVVLGNLRAAPYIRNLELPVETIEKYGGFDIVLESLYELVEAAKGPCISHYLTGGKIKWDHDDLYHCCSVLGTNRSKYYREFRGALHYDSAVCRQCWTPSILPQLRHPPVGRNIVCTGRQPEEDIYRGVPYIVWRIDDLRHCVFDFLGAADMADKFVSTVDYARWLAYEPFDGERHITNMLIITWACLQLRSEGALTVLDMTYPSDRSHPPLISCAQ